MRAGKKRLRACGLAGSGSCNSHALVSALAPGRRQGTVLPAGVCPARALPGPPYHGAQEGGDGDVGDEREAERGGGGRQGGQGKGGRSGKGVQQGCSGIRRQSQKFLLVVFKNRDLSFPCCEDYS